MPDEIGLQRVDRLHRSIGRDLPAVRVELRQGLGEIGLWVTLVVEPREIGIEHPFGEAQPNRGALARTQRGDDFGLSFDRDDQRACGLSRSA